MKAAIILQQIAARLDNLRNSKQLPDLVTQNQLSDLLLECAKNALLENDRITLKAAVNLANKLLRQGEYGFAKNSDKYGIIENCNYAEKIDFYRLSTELSELEQFFTQAGYDKGQYNSLEEFISQQKIIRVLFDYGSNFGNQAATFNLIEWLRKVMKFTGTIEAVYPTEVSDTIAKLINVPLEKINANAGLYYDENLNIKFITSNHFIELTQQNKIEIVALSLSGAVDMATPVAFMQGAQGNMAPLARINFANFLQTDIFIKFSPYHGDKGVGYKYHLDTRFHLKDNPVVVVQQNSRYKVLRPPIANLEQAKQYLINEPKGQKLLTEKPALTDLIDAVENKKINFVPAYGVPLLMPPDLPNLLNVIVGAAYAQKNGPEKLHKPLIIASFFHMQPMVKATLDKIFIENNWEAFGEHASTLEFKALVQELDLIGKVITVDLTDKTAGEKIRQLEPGKLLALFMGRLPKLMFDALFTNNLVAVLEGASALTNVLATDSAYLHCGNSEKWNTYIHLASKELQQRLTRLNEILCDQEPVSGQVEFKALPKRENWQPREAVELVGKIIIALQNPKSPESRFFQRVQKYAANPANQRIEISLQTAMYLNNIPKDQQSTVLADTLYTGYFRVEERVIAEQKVSLPARAQPVKLDKAGELSMQDANPAISYAEDFHALWDENNDACLLEPAIPQEIVQTSSASRSESWLTSIFNKLFSGEMRAMSAKEILQQLELMLQEIQRNGNSPSEEIQKQVIELLKKIKIVGTREGDTESLQKAYPYVLKLIANGEYGFTRDHKKYYYMENFFAAKPQYFYKLPDNFRNIDCLFDEFIDNPSESLESYLKSLKIIAVFFDTGANFGNQAANVNLIKRLRALGFTGVIRLIYPHGWGIEEKIAQLLDISPAELYGHHKELNIQFMRLQDFRRQYKAGKIATVDFAFTAAVDGTHPSDYARRSLDDNFPHNKLEETNFANYANAKFFIRLSPFHKTEEAKTKIYIKDDPAIGIQENSNKKFLIFPVAQLADTQRYLNSSPAGKALLAKKPALNWLISAVAEQVITIFPLYGTPLKTSDPRLPSKGSPLLGLINLILGAQNAQQKIPVHLRKPIVMTLFYEADTHILIPLQNLIQNNGEVYAKTPELKKLIADLKNINQFKIIKLDESTAEDQLKHLNPNQIVLLVTGKLSKTVFDALTTYEGPNIFTPVHEGASLYAGIFNRPHLHCREIRSWAIALERAEPALRKRLEELDENVCPRRARISDEQHLKTAELIGNHIIASLNPNSPESRFFQRLKHLKLDDDRIYFACYQTMKLVKLPSTVRQTALAPQLYYGLVLGEEFEHFISPEQQPELISRENCRKEIEFSKIENDFRVDSPDVCIVPVQYTPKATSLTQTSEASHLSPFAALNHGLPLALGLGRKFKDFLGSANSWFGFSKNNAEDFAGVSEVRSESKAPDKNSQHDHLTISAPSLKEHISNNTNLPKLEKLQQKESSDFKDSARSGNTGSTHTIENENLYLLKMPLTGDERIISLFFMIQFCRTKITRFTLPWNRIRKLSEGELNQLQQQLNVVIELMSKANVQKGSRVGKCEFFVNEFEVLEKKLRIVKQQIEEKLRNKKASPTELDTISQKIEDCKTCVHKFAQKNKELRQLDTQYRRVIRRSERTGEVKAVEIIYNRHGEKMTQKIIAGEAAVQQKAFSQWQAGLFKESRKQEQNLSEVPVVASAEATEPASIIKLVTR